MRSHFALLTVLGALGCGVACNGTPEAPRAESGGGESLPEEDELDIAGVTLPNLPHGVSTQRPPLSSGVRLAVATGHHERPPLDPASSLADVQSYVAGPLREWMLARGHSLREVRTSLAEAENAEEGEHVVAAAVLGVLYLRFALDLAELPLPDAVRSDEAASLRIRNALLRAAIPLLDGAMSAFGACVSASVGSADPSLEAWERFCDDGSVAAEDVPRPIGYDPPPPGTPPPGTPPPGTEPRTADGE